MGNRLEKVHMSYKHDDAHDIVLDAILRGLHKNNIPYSIDKYDIIYRDNIDDYEMEIGIADRVIMFVIPSYLMSLDCMFEMTQMFKNGNVRERVYPVVDMGNIPRNGDGLMEIKSHWQQEKEKKLEQIKVGGSDFIIEELKKINNIINTIDDLWSFICRDFTGNYEKLIDNDAALLIDELKKTLPTAKAQVNQTFIPSGDTMPAEFRTITQNGEKSLNIGNNYGSIIIN